ncbi:Bcr/CflA family drug resistance efflux transporter [Pseudomonas alkylphenolica]|uniref:Bcr/CflA family efflux transporter n=1 Tax=Pseudomonas alkylphenolica TaxID=237609 RepID=A0A443ZTM4_9PSED|nr:Bcr/CflA family drug resistance efflux transporter [Pseudomonas alkylphenolica]
MNSTTTALRPVSVPLLFLLGSLAAIAPLSTDMYLPAFSLIREDIGLAAGEVELSFSSYFIGMLIGMLCYGPVSDRVGRKLPLLIGLGLYVLASMAITQVDGLSGLVGWRFVQGLGGCAGAVLTFAIIRDRCDLSQSAQNISLLILIMGAAPILAPLLGGWVMALAGWRSVFSALTVFGVLLFVYALVVLDEPPLARHGGGGVGAVLRDYRELLGTSRFMTFVSIQALVMGCMFSYIIGSPFVLMEVHGIAPSAFGYFFAANAIGVMLAGQLNRALLKRFTPIDVLRRALWLPFFGGTLLVIDAHLPSSSLWLVLPGFFIAVFSVGFVNPNASALAMADQGRRAGKASAILNGAIFSGGMLAGVLLNLCYTGTTAPVAWLIYFSALMALFVGRRL